MTETPDMVDLAQTVGELRRRGIKAIVFDLDGTLYENDDFGHEISRTFARYIAGLKGIDEETARGLVRETRARLSAASGHVTTLSMACHELGGDLREAHRHMAEEIDPTRFMTRDDRVIALLKRLARRYDLLLYTNNNRSLTARILDLLGITGIFRQIVTIEDGWLSKPDPDMLETVLERAAAPAGQCLFVGDRYDVDLRLPAGRGCPVLLVKTVAELLQLAPLADP